jgi:hypothetical protein
VAVVLEKLVAEAQPVAVVLVVITPEDPAQPLTQAVAAVEVRTVA